MENFDLILSGGTFSNYLLGALYSARGNRVLLVDEQEIFVEQDKVQITLPVFIGVHEQFLLKQIFNDLDLPLSLENFGSGSSADNTHLFHLLDTCCQILTSKYRLIFSNDFQDLEYEIKREIGAGNERLIQFFSTLFQASKEIKKFTEDVQFSSRQNFVSAVDFKKIWGRYEHAFSAKQPERFTKYENEDDAIKIQNWGSAILASMTGVAPDNLCVEQLIRGLPLVFQNTAFFHGDIAKMKKSLAQKILSSGGTLKYGAYIESLTYEEKKIAGVVLNSHEGVISGDKIVLGERIKRTYQTLPKERQDSSLVRNFAKVDPRYWEYSLVVTVKQSALPEGMSANMVHIGSFEEPLVEENFLRIQVLPSTPLQNEIGIKITVLVPFINSSLDIQYLKILGGRMLRKLSDVIPFLEDNMLYQFPNIKEDQSIREYYPFKILDHIPSSLIRYYIRGGKGLQDFWGLSWATPHENLYLSGKSIWPSLGLFGEVLIAKKIFDDLVQPSIN